MQCPGELHPTRLWFGQLSTSLNKNVLSLHSPFLREQFVLTPAKRKMIIAFGWKSVWRHLKVVFFWPYPIKFIVALFLGISPYLLNDSRKPSILSVNPENQAHSESIRFLLRYYGMERYVRFKGWFEQAIRILEVLGTVSRFERWIHKEWQQLWHRCIVESATMWV